MRYLPANAQHIGDRRSQQDSFGFGDPENHDFLEHGGFLAVVCDGMGGMEFGDAASRAATRAFLDAYQLKSIAESIPTALMRSVHAANDEVVALAHKYGLTDGMGTTLVAVALHRSSMYYISVGDSGLFLSRGGSLVMLNRPHVFANLLDAAVAKGNMSREDADSHPERESLTSFIGAESLEEIDRNAAPFPLEDGDGILLASDGLFKTLSQSEMLECLAGPPQSWPETLVAQTIAKNREHQDNVTVLSIAAESDGASENTLDPRAPTLRRQTTVFPTPVNASPVATGPIAAVPVAAASPVFEGAPAQNSGTRSRSRAPMLLLIVIALAIAAGAWWYFHRLQFSKLSAQPAMSDPGSSVSAPPATIPHPPVKQVDPDAPVVVKPPAGKSR
jgi:serine/threonine protein phosphatase PrpC